MIIISRLKPYLTNVYDLFTHKTSNSSKILKHSFIVLTTIRLHSMSRQLYITTVSSYLLYSKKIQLHLQYSQTNHSSNVLQFFLNFLTMGPQINYANHFLNSFWVVSNENVEILAAYVNITIWFFKYFLLHKLSYLSFSRILEFDVPNVDTSGERRTLEIELWDVSGDRK